jgi:cathepsin X
MCEKCPKNHSNCEAVTDYQTYRVDTFGQVSGEDKMMQELYQNGPITCGIAAPAALDNYTSGIFNDTTGDVKIVHEVSVVGYGIENDVKYWNVRNSWGTAWGEEGFFRVVRGTNNLAIETDCAWAIPKDTWTNPTEHVHIPSQEEIDAVAKYNREKKIEALMRAPEEVP